MASVVADLTSDKNRKAFIGAISVRKDGAIVKSRNASIYLPEGKVPSSHAEARVMRKSGFGATVYVSRVKRDGSLAMAKPCSHCMASLKSRGVDMVYWTVSNNEWDGCKP